MKSPLRRLGTLVSALVLGLALTGCIVVPWGGRGGGHYGHDHYGHDHGRGGR